MRESERKSRCLAREQLDRERTRDPTSRRKAEIGTSKLLGVLGWADLNYNALQRLRSMYGYSDLFTFLELGFLTSSGLAIFYHATVLIENMVNLVPRRAVHRTAPGIRSLWFGGSS